MARELNIDLSQVTGTGRDGRVSKEDLINFKQPLTPQAAAIEIKKEVISCSEPQTIPRATVVSGSAEDYTLQITGVRKRMVQSMTAATAVPHHGFCDEYQTNNIRTLRAQMKPIAEASGVKLSYLPFLLKACSLALRDYPELNAHTNA